MNKKSKISLILGGMCVALSCGIAIQVRTISRIGTTTSRNSTENELRDAILRTKENYDNLYADEEKAEKLLENERKSATENNSELTEIQENIKKLSTQLGLTDVTGKGVIIKVDYEIDKCHLDYIYVKMSQLVKNTNFIPNIYVVVYLKTSSLGVEVTLMRDWSMITIDNVNGAYGDYQIAKSLIPLSTISILS